MQKDRGKKYNDTEYKDKGYGDTETDGMQYRKEYGIDTVSSEKTAAAALEEFIRVVAALRGENGCPWDRAQTMNSLKPCMINEMTEAIAAIDLFHETGSSDNLCEELGDVLLQVVLLAQIASEQELFQMEDVIRGVSQKMIRRHPHVFGGDPRVAEAEEIPGRWEEIKRLEKNGKTPEQKEQEKSAFKAAAGQMITHLEEKIRSLSK